MIKKLILCAVMLSTLGAYGFDEDCAARETGDLGFECSLGLAPSVWLDPGVDTYTACSAQEGCKLIELAIGQPVSFGDMFGFMPFYLSTGIYYNACSDIQLFGEFAYRRARGNFFKRPINGLRREPEAQFDRIEFDDFNSFGGYVGMRHYLGIYWSCVSPYVGFKAGIWHHRAISASSIVAVQGETETPYCSIKQDGKVVSCFPLYENNNTVSGGALFGCTADVFECVQFRLGVEVIAAGCLKPACEEVKPCEDSAQFVSNKSCAGSIGTDLIIPITFGFQYNF